jgi:hypothetical protein
LVIVFIVLIVFSCSGYVGGCISCPDCIVLFCLCWCCISCPDCLVLFCLWWWLYFLSWLFFPVLPMLVIIYLVLIIFFCSVYVGDCIFFLIVLSFSAYFGDYISCPDCLVLFCLCWWLHFLSWLSCLVLSMLVIVFLVLIVLSCSTYVGNCISCPDCLVLFCLCWWLYFFWHNCRQKFYIASYIILLLW